MEEKKIIDEDKPTYNELEKLCYLLSKELETLKEERENMQAVIFALEEEKRQNA